LHHYSTNNAGKDCLLSDVINVVAIVTFDGHLSTHYRLIVILIYYACILLASM